MDLLTKLEILADAAKYDASCASSGTNKRNSRGKTDGIGSTEGIGICHAYAPDGRCISLLKILLTNSCIYDCVYCINRRSSNVQRARFTVDEVVRLTLGFYRRNCIEGLFLSSGIIRDPDYTMERVVDVARTLRITHGFRGYIHLKTIPDADPALLAEAGRWADRLSINVELPTEGALNALAPEKNLTGIRRSMGRMRAAIDASNDSGGHRGARPPRFAPAGQSTQVIAGADDSTDAAILGMSANLYAGYKLRRVYYSAFSPIPDASASLPAKAAPALPGRLAASFLRLRPRRTANRQRRQPAACDRPETGVGARPSRPIPDRREHGEPGGAAPRARPRGEVGRPYRRRATTAAPSARVSTAVCAAAPWYRHRGSAGDRRRR